MFDFLFPNHPFGGHTLRLVAQAQQGGADIFDIARGMKNVEPGDGDAGSDNGWPWRRKPSPARRPRWPLESCSRRGKIFFTPATIIACPTCSWPSPKNRNAASAFGNPRN